tara:strand:+ start:326 stop:577 length:252 start_codon:yes stop_codon:yes gene_type:complete
MTDAMKVLLVGTALTAFLALVGTWGGWVTTTLMNVDTRTEVMTQKIDDTHAMLATIISKMSMQKATFSQTISQEAEVKTSLGK